MAALQEFPENTFEEETSDQQSILLAEIMNAIGFSKSEREINRHYEHPRNLLMNIFHVAPKSTITIAGSTVEGMRGGIYSNQRHGGDDDLLFRKRTIKLYPPHKSNVKNPLPLLIHDNADYVVSCFVEEEDNFPGYVKLSLAKVNCTNTIDDKQYLPNSVGMNLFDMTKPSKSSIPNDFDTQLDAFQKRDINGPAHTLHIKTRSGITKTMDAVYSIPYDTWPDSANSFITRPKPNNWPSKSMLEDIKSQGCDVVPVGHHDGIDNDIQWRISFPGERSLLLDLTDVQILCYALIKIILKENLNTSQREVVSSFHIKHVIFWCVESCSFQWVDSNYIKCLNICLTKLIQKIKARHIQHYIIESRNLFNSKMTKQMSREIVDVLKNCDTTHIFKLDAFEYVKKLTKYNIVMLKHMTLQSTIMAGFMSCFWSFSSFVMRPSLFWELYLSHNATESLVNYKKILQNWKKEKGAAIHYVKYVVRSMVGFLYYAKYKESNKAQFLIASKQLIQKSLDLDSSCIQLRAATFFLIHLEYIKSIEICDKFLTFPPRYKIDSGYHEYVDDIKKKVSQQLFEEKTTEETENIMDEILPMFKSSVKLKSLPGNYDLTQHNHVWIFRNLTNIFFKGLYADVTFMTAEKWVVPDPIQYELLSLPKNADNEVMSFSGIYLDPMLVCLQTKLLCYHSIGNVREMAEVLTLMNSFITENKFTTNSSGALLNMFTYCQIKAGHHKQSVKSILQSLSITSSSYNTASGYLKIVLQILNSLSI
jgi:hypothetical protein